MKEFIEKIAELVAKYNATLRKEDVRLDELTAIESELKEVAAKAKAEKTTEVYNSLIQYENPMLAAATMFTYEVPSYKMVSDSGVVTGMEVDTKVVTINPIDFTNYLKKDPKKSLEGGMSWIYHADALGMLLAYRTLKELGGSKDALDDLKKNYFIREVAMKEAQGFTPTSNTQLVDLLQTIINKLIFIPDEKGNNMVKARSCDAKFLLKCYTSHGRGVGAVKVLKGARIAHYIFEVCHMIITGKVYTVECRKRKDDVQRKPVNVPNPKAEPKKVQKVRKENADGAKEDAA